MMPEFEIGVSPPKILERPGKIDLPIRCMSEKEMVDLFIYIEQLEYCLGTDE